MKWLRIASGARHRPDVFGGICYTPRRDDFFALSRAAYDLFVSVGPAYRRYREADATRLRRLVDVGLLEERSGTWTEGAYSGPSFIGNFPELPTVSLPLVVNCFSTAWCPLLCKYCHADDLMTAAMRREESAADIQNVLATTRAVPALVAVITGGDPLSAPGRARALIEGLAGSKALVLDTSGVGDIDALLPVLIAHRVHVRVSLDSAIVTVNDSRRPVNPVVSPGTRSSAEAAERTIRRLVAAGVAVSVQTVVTSENEQIQEWRDLRDLIMRWGVRHWVIHIVVSGGKARRHEERAARQRRGRRLRPGPDVGRKLATLVRETAELELPIDIRCTDTDDRPNSVLLVASNGDLWTEGYAKRGKVRLFAAGSGRPDQVQALMAHLDRFGHARRYLNWSPWLAAGKSLEELCILVGEESSSDNASGVETEFKLSITDVASLKRVLLGKGFQTEGVTEQRDEYYDTRSGVASQNDYVIRLRVVGATVEAAFKGPRFFSGDGASSRLEFEVPTSGLNEARSALERKGLVRTWFIEKRRENLRQEDRGIVASIDEVPGLGMFLEVEGPLDQTRAIVNDCREAVGPVERRNYREIAMQMARDAGGTDPQGIEF